MSITGVYQSKPVWYMINEVIQGHSDKWWFIGLFLDGISH